MLLWIVASAFAFLSDIRRMTLICYIVRKKNNSQTYRASIYGTRLFVNQEQTSTWREIERFWLDCLATTCATAYISIHYDEHLLRRIGQDKWFSRKTFFSFSFHNWWLFLYKLTFISLNVFRYKNTHYWYYLMMKKQFCQ